LAIYEGPKETFNVGELSHQGFKFSTIESLVLIFISTGDAPYNFTVMKSDGPEWKWVELEKFLFTHPSLNFSFIIKGDQFMNTMSLLPQFPLQVCFTSSIRFLPPHMVGMKLLDVNSKRKINHPSPTSWEISHVLPHLEFDVKHVFEWGDKIVSMVFLGDKDNGQFNLGAWMIEDMQHSG